MKNIDLLVTLTQHERDANNVTIAFTMGLKAVKDGYDVELILLSDAVHLASKGYGDKIDIGAPFEPVAKLIKEYLQAGGRLDVCSACMQHNGVREDSLIEGSKIISADYVVDALMAAKKSLQLN